MKFVAEIGSNHKGLLPLAVEMIRQAKLAGADIAKFQLGHNKDDRIRYMPTLCIGDLMVACRYYDIEFMASIFDLDSIALSLATGMKSAKIAYSVAKNNPKLAWQVIDSPYKDVYISCPSNMYLEVDEWTRVIRRIHVVPKYPTYSYQVELQEEYGPGAPYYGYSSHVFGYADALIAIARGSCYIEKHVTLDKTEESIKDNAFALSFEEFGQMVKEGREIARLLC